MSLSSTSVQKVAFKLLRDLTKKQVKALTEAFELTGSEIDLEENQAKLPESLIRFLQNSKTPLFTEYRDLHAPSQLHSIFGFMLAWSLIMDNFEYASSKIKSGFSNHLKAAGVVDYFLTFLFDVFEYKSGVRKMFDLSKWQVDTFFVSEMDLKMPFLSIPLFSAHLYWSALCFLPSMVRGWYNEVDDRPLSIAVIEYVVSPLLTFF